MIVADVVSVAPVFTLTVMVLDVADTTLKIPLLAAFEKPEVVMLSSATGVYDQEPELFVKIVVVPEFVTATLAAVTIAVPGALEPLCPVPTMLKQTWKFAPS